MAIEITREKFDAMSASEQSQVIAEGAMIIDPGRAEAEARIELARADQAAERRRHAIKREAFDRMTQAQRDEHIRGGGTLVD